MPGPRVAIKIVQKNPNPRGACACSPHSKVVDCEPPYCVFTHIEAADPRQPHIVVGDRCMRAGVEKAHPGAFKVPEPVVVVEQAEVDVDKIIENVRRMLTPSVSQPGDK